MSANLPRAAGQGSGPPRVFISFDPKCDRDLYERLLGQCSMPGLGFSVLGGSESRAGNRAVARRVRDEIEEADQMIIICTEGTFGSGSVAEELEAARGAGTPYLLLWGRRQSMCTKPASAQPSDVIYRWAQDVLRDQVAFGARRRRSRRQTAGRNPS